MKEMIRMNIFRPFLLLTIVASLSACVPREPSVSDPEKNLDALWKIMDERYCYFEEKGVDWDKVHEKYRKELSKREQVSDFQLFDLLSAMLGELKDGHVNLISSFDVSSYSEWKGEPTEGLNIYARKKELPGVKRHSGGVSYVLCAFKDDPTVSFGYFDYGSFSGSLGDLTTIFRVFSDAKGLIIDLRGNGGGNLSNSALLLSRFFDERTLVGYMSHKTGPDHEDFSPLKPLYVEPYDNEEGRWTKKPVLILQDRSCYSATNDFLTKIALAKNVTRLGLKSGGGGGLPSSQELPNGWRVRFSSVRNYDADKKSIEGGIEPDIEIKGVSYYTDPTAPDLILRGALKYFYRLFHPEAQP